MNCKHCGKLMTDLSHGKGVGRHWVCLISAQGCGSHNYQKVEGSLTPNPIVHDLKWFTRKEWDAYVEDYQGTTSVPALLQTSR
jgi:hypothetical protein